METRKKDLKKHEKKRRRRKGKKASKGGEVLPDTAQNFFRIVLRNREAIEATKKSDSEHPTKEEKKKKKVYIYIYSFFHMVKET